MDTGQADHHLDAGGADRFRRGLLFTGLFALGLGYVGAFAFFLANSVDFVARQQREAAIAAAASLTVALPATLVFGTGSAGAGLLGPGWHRPEAGGTWSRDREALIQLPAAVRDARWLALEFEAHIDPERGELAVALDLDGKSLASWRPSVHSGVVNARITLPASKPTTGGATLRFRIDDPSSPLRNRTHRDGRALGIHLRRLQLEAPAGR